MKIKTKNNHIQIKQVHEPVGGSYGQKEINKEIFKKVIISFFGEDAYKSTLESSTGEDYKDLFDLESNIQYFKESLSSKFNGIFQRKNFEDSKITELAENEEYTLEIFIKDLKDQCKEEGPFKLDCTLFKYSTNSSLEDLINKFNRENQNLKLTFEVSRRREERWYTYIPYEIMPDITIDFVNKTCKKIEEIVDNPWDMNIKTIDSILYVGGYFSSQVVLWLVKKKLIEFF